MYVCTTMQQLFWGEPHFVLDLLCAQRYSAPVSETNPKQQGNQVEELRESRIFVKVSEAEKRKFQKVAKDRHTDISELIRQLLHREADMKLGRA